MWRLRKSKIIAYRSSNTYSELYICPNVQMLFNSEPTTTEWCKVKYSIYVYSESHIFPNVQVWLSNVASTVDWFFDKRCALFLRPFKYTSVGLKVDRPSQPNALTMNTWLILRIKELRFFRTKCTNFGFRGQSQV